MFNAPRRSNPSLSQSAFFQSSTSSNAFDPLAASTPNVGSGGTGGFDVDPWSGMPSPARGGTPTAANPTARDYSPSIPSSAGLQGVTRRESEEVIMPRGVEDGYTRLPGSIRGRGDGLKELIADPPTLYLDLLDQLEHNPSGDVPLSAVQRLLGTAQLPAATVEKIINLSSHDNATLSRPEFFCALALVALAQSDPSSSADDVSIERLSSVVPHLPLPRFTRPSATNNPSYLGSSSPWETSPRLTFGENGNGEATGNTGIVPSTSGYSIASAHDGVDPDVEAERGYWKRLETVEVGLVQQKEGWFLQKYHVESDKRNAGVVSRRYSDFVWLLDTLMKRYPFRILPSLPPKKIGPDAIFLEQRRKGLKRFINMIVNHPILRNDGALSVFLTEPAFEAWRKRVKVSLDEEFASRPPMSSAEEMRIPGDICEKLGILRDHLPSLLGSYQKLVTLAERSVARMQAATADASRMALALHTVGEEMPGCCHRAAAAENGARGHKGCSLCVGVGRGMGTVAEGWTRVAEAGEKRSARILESIESLKTQRDLYLAFRDLFTRHDRSSKDNVDVLRKRIETKTRKVESIRHPTSGMKAGWETEVDKLQQAIDADNASIKSLLERRVMVKACMWHELSVVLHSRQAAQVTLGWREFVGEEVRAGEAVGRIWAALGERLESMPVE